MPRPTVTNLGNAPGFAPAPSQPTQMGVPATTNVRAPLSSAVSLADALGLVSKIADPIAQEAQKRDAQAGATDSMLNRVDPKQYAQNKAYARAAFNNEAERQAQEFMQKWQDHYQNEVDKSLPPAAVLADLDSAAKGALGHYLGDPEAAAVIAPKIAEFASKVAGVHIAGQADERERRSIETVTQSITDDIANHGQTDFATQFQKLAPIVGNTKAKQLVSTAIVAAGERDGKPESITASLPHDITLADGTHIPGPASDPNTSEMVTKGIESAQTQKLKNELAAKEMDRAHLETGYVDRLTNRQWLTKAELLARQKEGRLQEGEVVSWYARSEAARLDELKQAKDKQLLVDHPEVPLFAMDISEEDRQRLLQSRTDTLAAQNGGNLVAAAIQTAKQNGIADARITTPLKLTPATQPKAFEQAAQIYQQIPPALRPQFVVSQDRRDQFERYLQLRSGNAGVEEAAKEIADFNPEFAKQNRERYFKETGTAAQSIPSMALDSAGVLGFGNTKVSDLTNNTQTANRIEARMKSLIERGMVPSDAVKAAATDVVAQSTLVRLSSGHSVLIPVPAGSPEIAKTALADAYKDIPAFAKRQGIVDAPKDAVLSYSPTGDSATMLLFDPTGTYPISSKPIKLTDIIADYTKRHDAAAHDALTLRNQRERERLKFQAEHPGNPVY